MENPTALLIMNPSDNIAIAVRRIDTGETVIDRDQRTSVCAAEPIPFGFKIALCPIAKDSRVYKYGEAIGKSIQDIDTGQLVHVHNLAGLRGRGDV